MTWGTQLTFPRAIIHVDGDGFFASCEVAKNPSLCGKPVITGRERGIVSACTYEAKALGIKTGMRLSEARKLCPDAVVLPSDYETYSLFSHRMYAIVRRYTPAVEEYGIDECFAELSGLRRTLRMTYPQIAASIKRDLELELGITFSIGLSCTKVLAKLGSKWNKPSGLTLIPHNETEAFLNKTPVGKVWGIGPNSAAFLNTHGVRTALDFVRKDEAWIRRLNKPLIELWQELSGDAVMELDLVGHDSYQSISKTRTFTPPSTDSEFVFSQLSKNIENACLKLRRYNLATPEVYFFLKTQEMQYQGIQIKLPFATSVPQDILREVTRYYPQVFKKGTRYRATGITLNKLVPDDSLQLDLFGAVNQSTGIKQVFDSVDAISERYGKHTLFLGSSFKAMTYAQHENERGEVPERMRTLFVGENSRKRLAIPFMGEVG